MMVPANRSRFAMVLRRLGLLACLAGAAGCATAGFANRGVQAEQAGDFDLAVVEYEPGDGRFTYEQVSIRDGWARWRGRTYQAGERAA